MSPRGDPIRSRYSYQIYERSSSTECVLPYRVIESDLYMTGTLCITENIIIKKYVRISS